MKISVVMPVYNERRHIGEILRRVQSVRLEGAELEIIVVDDGSTDGTREFLMELAKEAGGTDNPEPPAAGRPPGSSLTVILQEKNQGKGAALRRGFGEAAGDILLIQDADLEYDPGDYPKLLEPIQAGVADVVYGSRFLGGPQGFSCFGQYVGNKISTTLSNIFSNLRLTDMETCYKVFRRHVLNGLEIQQNRFGFEPEITAKFAKKGVRIHEVPISYRGRTHSEGKKMSWTDGLKAVYCIVRYSLFR